MRLLVSVVVVGFVALLSGCGSSGNQEAGKAFGVASAGMVAAMGKTTRGVLTEAMRQQLADSTRSAVWAAAFRAASRMEADEAADSERANYCDGITSSTSTADLTTGGHGTGTASCTVGCSGTPKMFNVACTMADGASITANCKGTTYTATKGSFGISFADAPIPTTPSTTNLPTFSFTLDLFVTGGGFKATPGSELKLSMSLNFGAFSTSTGGDFCSLATNFSATVDGASVSCSDLANGITACQ